MPASVSSPADVVNVALRRIGYELRVGSLYDGSKASNNALDLYAQTRDELLRQNDWGFAERNISMTALLLKTAPAAYVPGQTDWDPALYPPLPWRYEYQYPDDCLKVRALKAVPILIPNYDPQPNVWSVANDKAFASPPFVRKVILTYVPQAALVYTGQVTDPAQWEADFVEAIAAALGRRLAPGLGKMNVVQLAAQDEAGSTRVAEMEQG